MTPSPHIHALAQSVVRTATDRGKIIATAESCTGGMIGAAITDIPGSSAMFDRGFIAYSYEAKAELLGVPKALIEQHGAVSREVAEAMAEGALRLSRADVAVSVTGIAGPDGGTPDKPVGLVWFGLATPDAKTRTVRRVFSGSRDEVRRKSVETALEMLASAI